MARTLEEGSRDALLPLTRACKGLGSSEWLLGKGDFSGLFKGRNGLFEGDLLGEKASAIGTRLAGLRPGSSNDMRLNSGELDCPPMTFG